MQGAEFRQKRSLPPHQRAASTIRRMAAQPDHCSNKVLYRGSTGPASGRKEITSVDPPRRRHVTMCATTHFHSRRKREVIRVAKNACHPENDLAPCQYLVRVMIYARCEEPVIKMNSALCSRRKEVREASGGRQ